MSLSNPGLSFKIVLSLILVAMIGCDPLCAEGKKTYEEHLEAARGYLRHMQPRLAIEELDRALIINPKGKLALRGKCTSLHSLVQFQKEQEVASQYIKLYPAEPAGYFQRGIAYMSDNLTNKAIADFDKALSFKDDAVAFFNRASCHVQLCEYQEAIRDFTRMIELYKKPNLRGYFQRGRVYYAIGDYSLAVHDFTRALELDPQNSAAHLYRGRSYEAQGNADKALHDYDRSSILDSDYSESFYDAPVNESLQSAHSTPVNKHMGLAAVDQQLALALTKEKAGDIKGAYEECRLAARSNPRWSAPLVMMGDIAMRQKSFEEALSFYTRAWAWENMNGGALHGRANAFLALKDPQRALSDIGKIIWLDPDIPEPHYMRASALRSLGRHEQSLSAFKRYVLCAKRFADRSRSRKTHISTDELNPRHLAEAQKIVAGK